MDTPGPDNIKINSDLSLQIEGDVNFSPAARMLYSTAACMYKIKPLGVIHPKHAEDVTQVVKYVAQNNLSITGRGAGSSAVGQAVNKGIILDFTKYMNQIIEYDQKSETVRVQPGVIYGDLNRYLKQFNRYFAPDPSSGEYCTIGGMVANNASGAHALKNGSTVDYIESLEVVFSDGSIAQTKIWDTDNAEFYKFLHSNNTSSKIHKNILGLLSEHKEQIEQYSPRVTKNASGYRLTETLSHEKFNLGKLFCSSEGTLGLITEITLRVKRPPKYKNLIILNFDKLDDAARAIEPIMELGPSALEMMEKLAIKLVREYRSDLRNFYPDSIESQLYVEFDGDEETVTKKQADKLISLIRDNFPTGVDYRIASEAREQAELWKIRKASFPLVYQQRRPEKVPAFIEDFVVQPKDIAGFIRHLYSVYKKYDIEAMILGHAGSGNFHTRPFIDQRKMADLEKMQSVLKEISDWVIKSGGAISGEHGDGRARAHILIKQAGPLYPIYEQVKQIFDPNNIFNPDVKLSKENQLIRNLRFHPKYKRVEQDTFLHFENDDYYYEIEKCHGCSACHQSNVTTSMCPIFQITNDELASPRGKSTILQHLIAGDINNINDLDGDYKTMLDYCIYCEACYVECPSNVDVGRLLQEHKARYRAEHGATILQKTLEYSEWMSRLQSWFAPLVNPMMEFSPVRWLMEKAIGIDRRRPLPKVATQGRFKLANRTQPVSQAVDKIVFFHDIFARYNNPDLTALAISILEFLGIEVQAPALHSAAIPPVIYGNLNLARKTISYNAPILAEFIRNGYKIISTEPTAVLGLRKEWHDVAPSGDTEIISQNSFEFFEYLRSLSQRHLINFDFYPVTQRYAYHAPCHLKALKIGQPGVEILRSIPGIDIHEINRGCCGIAGTYGFKKGENGYNQSMKIGAALFEELKRPENSLGLSECSTCRMQMEHGSQKQVLHPIQVLATALAIEPK